MQRREADQDPTETLRALEDVLTREFRALVTLDGPALDRTTEEKGALDDELRGMKNPLPDLPPVRSALERIKASALVNQALMVHARACLHGAMRIATGEFSEAPSYARSPSTSPPVRVNVRG
jgi:hypothetical protein